MSRRSRTGVETFRELVFRFDVWPVVDEVFEAGVTHVEAKVNSIGDSFLVNGAFPNFCALLGKAFSGLFNKLEIDDAIDNFSAILGLGFFGVEEGGTHVEAKLNPPFPIISLSTGCSRTFRRLWAGHLTFKLVNLTFMLVNLLENSKLMMFLLESLVGSLMVSELLASHY